MKQTAVDWLIDKLDTNLDINHSWRSRQYIEKAKEMEKEQIEKTFKQAQECAVKADGVYFKYESFEQYYKETFKSE